MTDFLRRYTLASYLVALMFIINPILDAATNAWPYYFGSAEWRFTTAAIASGYFVSLLFGLLLLGAIAHAKGQKNTLRLVGAVSGLLTLFLLVASVGYILDTFQVRAVVREEQVEMFRIGALKTGFKIGAALLGNLVMTIASFKAAKDVAANAMPAVLMRPS